MASLEDLLPEHVVERAAARGIDLDHCYDELLAEVREMPSPSLLRDLGIAEATSTRQPKPRQTPRAALTDREFEVLLSLAEGLTNEEIGSALFVSGETVKAHVRSILATLNAKNRTHAVALAYHLGLLQPRKQAT